MTEQEWHKCSNPAKMLDYIRGKSSERKLRLFKTACCRRIWQLLTEVQSRKAVEAVEALADGALSTESFDAFSQDGRTAYYHLNDVLRQSGSSRMLQARLFAASAACLATCDSYALYNLDACSYAASTSEAVGDAVGHSTEGITRYAVKKADELRGHATMLRDIMGNPFRASPCIEPAWLTWNDGAVVKLAQAIYDLRSFDRMAVLADTLEKAGCRDQEILDHCRNGKSHVRGCWVVDLLLDKE